MAAEGKQCGSCGMCCKLMGIEPLDKRPGRWCPHFARGTGCGIYEARPGVCRSFECDWLQSTTLGDEWRPDRSRFVLSYEPDRKKLSVVVDPAYPLAWKQSPYLARLKRLAARSAQDGSQVIVCIADRRIVVFVDEEIDLGVVNPEHRIVSGYATVEGEERPYAMVLSDPAA